jgi:hypothetical protein
MMVKHFPVQVRLLFLLGGLLGGATLAWAQTLPPVPPDPRMAQIETYVGTKKVDLWGRGEEKQATPPAESSSVTWTEGPISPPPTEEPPLATTTQQPAAPDPVPEVAKRCEPVAAVSPIPEQLPQPSNMPPSMNYSPAPTAWSNPVQPPRGTEPANVWDTPAPMFLVLLLAALVVGALSGGLILLWIQPRPWRPGPKPIEVKLISDSVLVPADFARLRAEYPAPPPPVRPVEAPAPPQAAPQFSAPVGEPLETVGAGFIEGILADNLSMRE